MSVQIASVKATAALLASGAMIRALADLAASSKTVVFGKGLHDGTRRDYFFQRIEAIGGVESPPRTAYSF